MKFQSHRNHEAPRYQVLLVEDNRDSVAVVKAWLNDPRIEVTVASDGAQGIQAFKETVFDLVLMDIQMPVLDGCDTASAIRRWEKANHLTRTPITALTALSTAADLGRIFESGCSNYLPKPVTKPMLLQAVGQFLSAPPRNQAPSLAEIDRAA